MIFGVYIHEIVFLVNFSEIGLIFITCEASKLGIEGYEKSGFRLLTPFNADFFSKLKNETSVSTSGEPQSISPTQYMMMVLGLFNHRLMKYYRFSIRFKSVPLPGQSKTSTASRRSRSFVYSQCPAWFRRARRWLVLQQVVGYQCVAQSECRRPRSCCPGP